MGSEFQPVLELLWKHGVDFIVIGGRAEQLMGSPRVTHDIDICYQRSDENIERLTHLLKDLQAGLRVGRTEEILPVQLHPQLLRNGMNFTFLTRYGPFDTLGEVEPIGRYEDLHARAEAFEAFGHEILSIALDDLIAVKRHVARGKDTESLHQLLAIKRLREQGLA